jgi:hypothetical protein
LSNHLTIVVTLCIGTDLAATMVIVHLTWDFLGGNQKKHTVAYLGIKLSRLSTKRTAPIKQGINAGVVFQPISFKTLLKLEGQCPYSPYCTLKHGRNPKITKVTGIMSRLMVKSGTILLIPRNGISITTSRVTAENFSASIENTWIDLVA